MAFLRYWRSVVWMAARHSLDHTQTVLFVGFLICGGAAYFYPALLPMMVSESGWAAAAGAFGSIILLRLVLAPYWLDQEKSRALEAARQHPHGAASKAIQQRVPILRLIQAAEEDGWTFLGSRNALHAFGQALRQAALDKKVQIQGRQMQRSQDSRWASRNIMLKAINPDYFEDHWLSLHSAWLPPSYNTLSRASDVLDKEPIYFIDLHVLQPEAWEWLHGEGRAARDMAMALEAAEHARVAANPIRQDEGEDV